jgi:predicted anti-sigma-YlaC factor YlaD
MNAGFDRQFPHFSVDVWEGYALGMQSEEDCASLEEHLLICPACQNLLTQADEYIQTVRSALARTAKRLSKPVAAATSV